MNALIAVNNQPYGLERAYDVRRLATALSRRDDVELRVFLLVDGAHRFGAACALLGASSGSRVRLAGAERRRCAVLPVPAARGPGLWCGL